ncbi:uncharacterized protein LOC100177851 [Ciona intestinalis]
MKLKVTVECDNKGNKFFEVKRNVTWRSEKVEISTSLLKSIPPTLLFTFLKKAAISAAICNALIKNYPKIETSNFRENAGVLVCDVTNDESFHNDVISGSVDSGLQAELQRLVKGLEGELINPDSINIKCTAEGFSLDSYNEIRKRNKNNNLNSTYVSKKTATETYKPDTPPVSKPDTPPPATSVKHAPENTEKDETRVDAPTESERVHFFDLFENFEDFMKGIDDDDKELCWNNKQYKEALPVLLKDMDRIDMDEKDRGVLQLKIGLCLMQVGRVRESASYISDGIESLKRGDPSSSRCEQLGDSVREIAKRYRECAQMKKAMHILKCAAWLYQRVNDTTTVYASLMKCLVDLRRLGVKNSPSILKSMHDVHDAIFRIQETRMHSQATMISQCMAGFYLGCALTDVDKEDEALGKFKLSVDLFEEKLGVHAKLQNLYGVCLQNLGTCLVSEGRLYEAEETYVKALESENMATDWDSPSEKQRSITMTERSLTSLRLRIAKRSAS